MQDTAKDLAVYVLSRTDLPSMTPGKMAAQVHHAGVQMISKHGKDKLVQEYINGGNAAGADYFNTTLVLGATLNDIFNTKLAAKFAGYPHGIIVDPSYPFIVPNQELANLIPQDEHTKVIKVWDDGRVLMVRPETTVAWFLGDRNNVNFRSLFNTFDLHP
jgi:peptidyl-tRNA hydrolase